MPGRPDEKEESPITVALVALLAVVVVGFLIWLVASQRIVYASLKPALWSAALWKLLPYDYAIAQWNGVATEAMRYSIAPNSVSFPRWAYFISIAFRPLAIIAGVAYLGFLVVLGFRRKPDLRRRITADQLMLQSMKFFTGIAPVIKLRKQLAQDKHPLWRRQVTPEEVFLGYRVPRSKAPSSGSLAKPGMPMNVEGKFDREVARAYFIGAQELLSDGRLVSRMLGRQIINLMRDAAKAKASVFADRLSSEGKVLLGLWAAVAFGGKAGRDEYCKYRDQLNLSAYGTSDGICNLALAQPLYEKYRKHPSVNQLFSIHHWEHTFLFALLALAQKRGRYTTAEVLWLRPLNRVMFFSLNSRGSYTPHTEAAATFAQYAFETRCAKLGRLPLMPDGESFTHMIYVDKAVDGLEEAYRQWMDADQDDDEDWWLKKDIWKSADATLQQAALSIVAAVPTAPMPGANGETAFDQQMAIQTNQDRLKREAEEQAALASLAGSNAAFAQLIATGGTNS